MKASKNPESKPPLMLTLVDTAGLSPQTRVNLFADGVKALIEHYKIGMTIPQPEIKFVDLTEKKDVKETDSKPAEAAK